ncbi:MAG: 1-acyl-sn-glycerol-3-phosphate acyltransferase [Paracoccaceae bacterium]
MFRTVQLPLWLLVLILAFAGVTFASHFLFPSVRWFFRARAERALARINARLDRPIELFRLARRQDMIVRLTYDPKVLEAVTEHAAETGVPGAVAFEEARGYAREIVPGFSATLYFGVAVRLTRWVTRGLYRVRIGKLAAELDQIDPRATVIFVINHRSNADYLIVAWLVSGRAALSFAVGEWARIWPLSRLIRATGAYFIRRGSRNTLYRRVLARYVQMTTAEGTTQAIFPEGGLSLNGRVGAAKLGLLSYVMEGYVPDGRDVVFVPVGLAYDRVLEDRVLTRAAALGVRRFRVPVRAALGAALGHLWRRLRGRFKGFGTAAAGFGQPVSLREHLAAHPGASPEALGALLMARIEAAVPVLPVPLVAAALMQAGAVEGAAGDEAAVAARVEAILARLSDGRAVLRLHPQGLEASLKEGLAPLRARGLIGEDLRPAPGAVALLEFYAAPVRQRLEAIEAAATQQT